jgi:hypothetical protein
MLLHDFEAKAHSCLPQGFNAVHFMLCHVDFLKIYLVVGDLDVLEDVFTLLYQLVVVVEVDMP